MRKRKNTIFSEYGNEVSELPTIYDFATEGLGVTPQRTVKKKKKLQDVRYLVMKQGGAALHPDEERNFSQNRRLDGSIYF